MDNDRFGNVKLCCQKTEIIIMIYGRLRLLLVAVSMCVFSPGIFASPTFVYTNNDVLGPNSVSGFSVDSNGILTQITGSPFGTGGSGTQFSGLYSSNRIVVSTTGNFLFVANANSADISAFSIDPLTGFLKPVPNSPFSSGGNAGLGMSLAVTPDGQFLMAGLDGSFNVAVFRIAPDGSLSAIVGSPFYAFGRINSMKVTPDGKLLVIAQSGGVVQTFLILADGVLRIGPFLMTDEPTTGLDIRSADNRFFLGSSDPTRTLVQVIGISSNGALESIPGSPFVSENGRGSNVVLLSPDERFLFVSNQNSNSVTVFSVLPNGSLIPASTQPFPVNADHPAGLAIDETGGFLFTANLGIPSLRSIGVFRVNTDGSLTPAPGSPFLTHQTGGLLSLVAYPPKTFQSAFDICIKDDGNRNILRINSRTGAYKFSDCSVFTLSGRARIVKRGSVINLEDFEGDHRVLAKIDTSVSKGTATIQSLSNGATFTIVDRNTMNNSCACTPQ